MRSGSHVATSRGLGPLMRDHFFIGPENDMIPPALEMLFREGTEPCSPCVFYGPSGTGKTHLLHGIVALWNDRHPDRTGLRVSAVDFARDLARALDRDERRPFRRRYRGSGLLALDGVEALGSKPAAQEELLQAWDALERRGGRLVVSAQRPPRELSSLTPKLRSHLVGGLSVNLVPPDETTREAVIGHILDAWEVSAAPKAVALLADKLSGTIPQIHADLAHMEDIASRQGPVHIDVPFVERFLQWQADLAPSLSLRDITALTSKYFSLRMGDIRGASRRRSVVRARGIVVYLARQFTKQSYQQIGRYLGDRDHTTILHSYRETERRLADDLGLRDAAADLRRLITAR